MRAHNISNANRGRGGRTPLAAAALGGLLALAACASPPPSSDYVRNVPAPYTSLDRSPSIDVVDGRLPMAPQPLRAIANQPIPKHVTPVAAPEAPSYDGASTRPAVAFTPRPTAVVAPTPQPVRSVGVPSAAVAMARVTNFNDLPALERQEDALATRSGMLSTERRAALRVAESLARYDREATKKNRHKMVEAMEEYAAVTQVGGRLPGSPTVSQMRDIERTVQDRADVVREERKHLTRLIVALKGYQRSANDQNRRSLDIAIEKYERAHR